MDIYENEKIYDTSRTYISQIISKKIIETLQDQCSCSISFCIDKVRFQFNSSMNGCFISTNTACLLLLAQIQHVYYFKQK